MAIRITAAKLGLLKRLASDRKVAGSMPVLGIICVTYMPLRKTLYANFLAGTFWGVKDVCFTSAYSGEKSLILSTKSKRKWYCWYLRKFV